MTERNIANEVLDGLREIREHRAGKRTLRTVRVEPRPTSTKWSRGWTLTPSVLRGDLPRSFRAIAAMLRGRETRRSSPSHGR